MPGRINRCDPFFLGGGDKGEGWFLLRVSIHESCRLAGVSIHRRFFPIMSGQGAYLTATVLAQQGKDGIADDQRLLPQNEMPGIRHANDFGPRTLFFVNITMCAVLTRWISMRSVLSSRLLQSGCTQPKAPGCLTVLL